MQDSPVRVAVIGAGRWGRHLVRVFSALGVLDSVVDTDAAARQAALEGHGVPVFRSFDEMLAEREPTAAAVATPAESHTHVGLRCLDAGLDVFVEKPLALSVEDAELLVSRAAEIDRILMTGHLMLYHPAVRALKELVGSGELGELRYIYSNRLNLGRVRREENILWSFAPHDIAVILHLLDATPSDIEAVGGSWLQPDIADVTVTHLGFPGGVKAHVFVSWLHPYKEHKLIAVGSRKMAVFDDLASDDKLVVMDVGVDVDEAGVPTERQGTHHAVPLPDDEPLMIECAHFVERCVDRAAPLTDGRHGLEVLRVLAEAEKRITPTRRSAVPDPR